MFFDHINNDKFNTNPNFLKNMRYLACVVLHLNNFELNWIPKNTAAATCFINSEENRQFSLYLTIVTRKIALNDSWGSVGITLIVKRRVFGVITQAKVGTTRYASNVTSPLWVNFPRFPPLCPVPCSEADKVFAPHTHTYTRSFLAANRPPSPSF